MRVSRSGAPFPRVLSVFKSHISLSCPEADLRVWKPPRTSPQALPSSTGSPAKVFGRMGCGEGEPFSKKVLPPRRVFPHFKSSSAACGLALPARFPLRNGYPLLRRPFGVPPGRAPHQARPPAGSGETSGAGGALAVVPQPVPLLQQKKSPVDRGQKKTPSRWERQGGLERSLAAAYFPT